MSLFEKYWSITSTDLAQAYGLPDSHKTLGTSDKGDFVLPMEGRAERADVRL
jgi:hypothetical protein